jgi:GH15 family glucan-1,4-alpha-glucosidase
MSTPLENYALLADLTTAPLVSLDGSIDWLCLPRFDSPATFSAILGDRENGRWQLGIVDGEVESRGYRGDTFVLDTIWRSPTGRAKVTDFLPPAKEHADLIRLVECLEGTVVVEHDVRLRLGYGSATPLVRPIPGGLSVVAGPAGLMLVGPGLDGDEPKAEAGDTPSEICVHHELRAGEKADWHLVWFPSHEELPGRVECRAALADAVERWTEWSNSFTIEGEYVDAVRRSLLVLRGLTYGPTGGIVAAPTTSLPEEFGGSRNWDYRYTWLRDAALTIEVLADHTTPESALPWRDWLLRAIAGDVRELQIMYGIAGERSLPELELPHLSGYEDSRPVRIGNGAVSQYQADVVGEVMLALAKLRDHGLEEDEYSWKLQRHLLQYCERHLDRKDHGIWEMRGDEHYFTHGRVMMWAAFDQGVRAVREYGLEGDDERWARLRDGLRAEILERGYNEEIQSFTQTYDNTEVDASLLQLPHTGFVAYDDPRMLSTVARIERDLVDEEGFVYRYRTESGLDGLEGHEYPFLICTFWLIEQYAMSGREDDARALMDKMLAIRSPLGLLSEEYDPATRRLAGNYPQAFSHLSLVRAAHALSHEDHGRTPRAGATG